MATAATRLAAATAQASATVPSENFRPSVHRWRGQPEGGERRHAQCCRGRLAVPALGHGLDDTHVADAAAAVALRVRVQHLAPLPGERQSDAVALVRTT